MTRSVLLSAFVCGLLIAACSRPTGGNAANAPANTPTPAAQTVQHERAYVVSCAPTMDNKSLTWFESGSDVPFPAEALPQHIETLAKAGGNWNAKDNRSENRIALRIDARASAAEFWRFVDALLAAHVYKFALAMLQEFDGPFHMAGGGEAKWELDERYLKLEFPIDEGLDRPGPVAENGFSLGLNLLWSSKFSRCTLQTVFERDAKPIAEIEPLFPELLPAAAEGKPFKRASQGIYSFATKLGEEALEKAAKAVKGELRIVEIGESARALSGEARHAPAEHPPVAYLFLALDAIQRLNASRKERGLEPAAVRFTFGAAKGRRLTGNGVTPVPPKPEVKPPDPTDATKDTPPKDK